MPSHRARGYGRFVALRTATPRHGVPAPRRALAPILLLCGLLSLTGLSLIGLRITQQQATGSASSTWFDLPGPVFGAIDEYTPRAPVAGYARRQAKERPPELLGTLGRAELTAYCRATIGPLTSAVPEGSGWICRPLFGEPVPIAIAAACRHTYGDDARGETGNAGPRIWRCYRDPS